MKITPIRFCGFAILMSASLLFGAMAAGAHGSSDWPAYELPIGEGYREGTFQEYPAPVDGMAREDGRQSIHVVHVIPGQSYRLGFRLRSDQAKKISVSLFDRWPYAEGARPIQLSTGGGLRGMQGEQEFQWWFSVDKESVGSLLYIKIAVEPGFISESSNWKYQLFIVDSPRSSMNTLGRGVVYHRGPSNLELQENRPSVALRYQAFPRVKPVRHVANGGGLQDGHKEWRPAKNLIQNGDFAQGLAGWQLLPDNGKGVGVFDAKLRIWGHESSEASGVMQRIDADMAGHDSLQLSMDVMITAQAVPFQTGGPSPLALSICYEDSLGTTHCGDTAYRKYFAIKLGKALDQPKNVVFLPVNVWSRYTFDFMQVNSKTRKIISVELSGSGAPERGALIRNIELRR